MAWNGMASWSRQRELGHSRAGSVLLPAVGRGAMIWPPPSFFLSMAA